MSIVVFIAILAGKLPPNQQSAARQAGLGLAMLMRICLLLTISWVMGLTNELFSISSIWTSQSGDVHGVSGRDLIMLIGGLFLIGKATTEIHAKLEGIHEAAKNGTGTSFVAVITQIVLIDIVFSLDSVITAVGMVSAPPDAKWVGITVMVAAIVASVIVMLLFSRAIARFVDQHPNWVPFQCRSPLSDSDRRGPHGRGFPLAHFQGLHLLRHGFCPGSGNAKFTATAFARSAEAASAI